MASLEVKAVRGYRDRARFLRFPWRLYSSDPNWVCPLRRSQAELAGFRQHPFYDDAESQAFLAERGGRVCGRITAIVNHAHNRRYEERRGFFGFFEAENDSEIAVTLMDAARGWLSARGIEEIRGPMNPSYNYEMGLLVEGFDSPPTFMMTYNPPYYEELIETCGFHKAKDLYAYSGHVEQLSSLESIVTALSEEVVRQSGVTLRAMDPDRFQEDVAAFLENYNAANTEQWGFVPLSEGEMKHMAGSLRHLVVPELTSIAEIDGRTVGTVLGMLDYNPRIREIDGRLFPTGFLRLVRNRGELKKARVIAGQVLPEFQRHGLAIAMMVRILPDFEAFGLEECEFSWVMEDNVLSRRTIERAGGRLTKTYRLYDD